MSRCFLLVLFLSSLGNYGAYGTSLDRDSAGDLGAGLVRREVQKVQVSALRTQRKERHVTGDITICNENFVVGPANGTGDCLSDHTHILTEQLCEKAAAAVNAPLGSPFETPRALDPVAGNINTHPKGCYSRKDNITGKVTYHFNSIPDEVPTPHIEDGEAAVCRRDRYKKGAADTNDCPSAEYKILYNMNMCEKAAVCLRYQHDGTIDMDFDIVDMDMTHHDHYPAGCFVHPTELPGEVYYNPDKHGQTQLALPLNPQGRIICIAESVDIAHPENPENETSGDGE